MMTPDDKTMLALAALTYRGFGKHSEKAIQQDLLPWFPKVAAEGLGKWELVWGPASFRVPTSLVDDAMVYVAREELQGTRPRYVVAIRGTNPLSAFDWVFGDFWVALQIPWDAHAVSDGDLSASSALGLEIIRNLAADTPPSDKGGLAAFGNKIMEALSEFSADVPELEPLRVLKRPAEIPDSALMARIEALVHRETLRSRAFKALLRRFGVPSVEQTLFDAIMRQIRGVEDKGEKLLAFLSRSVPEGAIVAVTGHSKGGALATAVALWLEEDWASNKKAEIQCFSFAGPTAGTAAFVRRYDKRLGSRTRRIVNALDIVPQGWVPEQLKGLGKVYPELKPSIGIVVASLAGLNYAHVGGEIVEIESKLTGKNLIENLVYQHLDAYLKAANLGSKDWNAQTIFVS